MAAPKRGLISAKDVQRRSLRRGHVSAEDHSGMEAPKMCSGEERGGGRGCKRKIEEEEGGRKARRRKRGRGGGGSRGREERGERGKRREKRAERRDT
eukprot:1328134-Rhodomonas_salina.5